MLAKGYPMKYADKLKDPRWQKKRLEILERDEWTCRKCGDTKKTLNVHHMRYIPGREPWDIDSRLLLTLCESCHEEEKELRQQYENDLLEILKDQCFLADDVYSIASAFLGLSSQYPSDVTATIIEFAFREKWDFLCELYFSCLEERRNKSNGTT